MLNTAIAVCPGRRKEGGEAESHAQPGEEMLIPISPSTTQLAYECTAPEKKKAHAPHGARGR